MKIILAALVLIWALPVYAKMAPSTEIKASQIITGLESTKNLSKESAKVLAFTKAAKEIFGDFSVRVYGGYKLLPASMSDVPQDSVVRAVSNLLTDEVKWKETPSKSIASAVAKHASLLKETFGEKSYEWSWFLLSLSKKGEAKGIVQKLYDDEFSKVMALLVASYGLGSRTPLTDAEKYFNALKVLEDPAKQDALNEKMRQMKVHISNLPQSHIVT